MNIHFPFTVASCVLLWRCWSEANVRRQEVIAETEMLRVLNVLFSFSFLFWGEILQPGCSGLLYLFLPLDGTVGFRCSLAAKSGNGSVWFFLTISSAPLQTEGFLFALSFVPNIASKKKKFETNFLTYKYKLCYCVCIYAKRSMEATLFDGWTGWGNRWWSSSELPSHPRLFVHRPAATFAVLDGQPLNASAPLPSAAPRTSLREHGSTWISCAHATHH